jgi:hypothetical protein
MKGIAKYSGFCFRVNHWEHLPINGDVF